MALAKRWSEQKGNQNKVFKLFWNAKKTGYVICVYNKNITSKEVDELVAINTKRKQEMKKNLDKIEALFDASETAKDVAFAMEQSKALTVKHIVLTKDLDDKKEIYRQANEFYKSFVMPKANSALKRIAKGMKGENVEVLHFGNYKQKLKGNYKKGTMIYSRDISKDKDKSESFKKGGRMLRILTVTKSMKGDGLTNYTGEIGALVPKGIMRIGHFTANNKNFDELLKSAFKISSK